MNPCDELAPLLAAHASGDCSPEENGRVEAHLAGCEACTAERESFAELLALASLPEASELEQHALSAMPGQIRAAWQAQERERRSTLRYVVTGIAAVAAVAMVVLSPIRLGHLEHTAQHLQVVASAAPTPAEAAATPAQADVEAMADGPLELADDDSADPFSFDPEVAAPMLTDSDEGDEP